MRRQLPPPEEKVNFAAIQLKPLKQKKEKKEEVLEEAKSSAISVQESESSTGDLRLDSLEMKKRKSSMKSSKTEEEFSSVSSSVNGEKSKLKKNSLTVESIDENASSVSISESKDKSSKAKTIEEQSGEAKKIIKKKRTILPKEEVKLDNFQLKPTPKKVKEETLEVTEEQKAETSKFKGQDIGSGGVELDKLNQKKVEEEKSKREVCKTDIASMCCCPQDILHFICTNSQEYRHHESDCSSILYPSLSIRIQDSYRDCDLIFVFFFPSNEKFIF